MSDDYTVSVPLINHKYKLIYFPIFKTGCYSTSLILEGLYHFNKIHLNEITENYSDYYKFTFVRNPYKRFNSAVKYLINMTRNENYIEEDSFKKVKFKFNDLFSDNLSVYSKNHLKLQSEFWNFTYDYIGYTDTLHYDLCNILIKNNIKIIDKHLQYIKMENNINNTSKNKNITFDKELLEKVNEFYKKDFEIFNFKVIENIDEIDLISSKQETDKIYDLIKENIIPIEETEFRVLYQNIELSLL